MLDVNATCRFGDHNIINRCFADCTLGGCSFHDRIFRDGRFTQRSSLCHRTFVKVSLWARIVDRVTNRPCPRPCGGGSAMKRQVETAIGHFNHFTALTPRHIDVLGWRADNGGRDQELAEAGELPSSLDQRSLTRIAPGESVGVSWRRRVDVIQRAGHYRLVLALAGERGRAFRPSFSASVQVASERRVVALSSGSHRARVVGVGTRRVRLTVAPVRVPEGRLFALDFRLQAANAQEKLRKVAIAECAPQASANKRADRSNS